MDEKNYEYAKKHYKQLLSLTRHIIFDTAKELKIRKITGYEYFTMIIGDTPWMQAFMHEVKGRINGGVCIKDITHCRDEAVVVSKKLHNYTESHFKKICNVLTRCLGYQQLDRLHHFMIEFVARSQMEEAQQYLIELEQNREILRKAREAEENKDSDNEDEIDKAEEKKVFNAALETVTMFMDNKIYVGPMGLGRKVDREELIESIKYINDPITKNVRKQLNDNTFMDVDIGSLVIVDMESFYMFNYDDVLEMHYPYKLNYELATIHEWDRWVPDGPEYVEIYKNEKWEGIRKPFDDKSDDDDLKYKYTVDEIDNIDSYVLRLKVSNFTFGYTDNIIQSIIKSKHFIKHCEEKNITICMGFQEDDKVFDYINMEQDNIKLQEIIKELKEENNRLKQANNKGK